MKKYKGKQISQIPSGAYALEVFHIRGGEAFIGFKVTDANFHYVQVPFTGVLPVLSDSCTQQDFCIHEIPSNESSLFQHWKEDEVPFDEPTIKHFQ